AHQANQVRRVPEGRMLIFEMSLEERVEGSVVKSRSALAISALRRLLRGRSKPVDETDGKAFPTGQTFASTFVADEKLYGLVRKDVAREHGLIDDDNFPTEVDTAFDRAGELNGRVEANRQAQLETEIRLERGYEHLYTLLTEADGIGDGATAATRLSELAERYQQAVGRLSEDLVEHAVQRDADQQLSEQYARAKQNAQSLLAWHQRTPAERGDTPKPELYEPHEAEASPKTVRHPVAGTGDGLLTPTPDEAQPALPRYLDADLRKLAVSAASFGGAWAGGRVPPRHQLLRELLKADALREKLSGRRQERDAAQRAGDVDLAALRGGQIAYLQQALEDTVTSAGETLREFNRRIDALLETADNPAPQDDDAAGMARDTVRHLLDGGDLSVLAGEVADRRQAHERARNNRPADGGSADAGLLLDRANRLAHDLRPARVRDAATRVAEQLPEPSVMPPTRSAAELTDPQRRAAHQLENPSQGALHRDEKTEAPTHYEEGDGRGYDVHDPHDPHDTENPGLTKGEGLPLALAAGLDALHASGDWHGRPYADGTARQIAAQVRGTMSDQALREPELAATWYGPELGDTFTPEDLDAAGLTGRLDDRHQREFAQDGVLHGDLRLAPRASGDARHAPGRGGYRVPLVPDEKAALLSRQLLRGGDAEIGGLAEAGYDNAASDYVPQLFANRHAVNVRVVIPGQGDLVYRPWRPDAAPDAAPGRPTVHLLLDDGAFKALIPRSPRELPEETDPRHSPNGVPERENAGPAPRDHDPVATPSRTEAESPAPRTHGATPGTPGGHAG
ncbi:hypothetical protein ACFU99_13280, partial [Streptomyces sp. NPDC057654]|uniref:hypothetical protein n=1 Tax=Streptomyces sp. NPDC057654 TaxID=3346196 RepID=UPI003685012A